MKTGTLFLVALACAAGVFSTRFLPMIWHSKGDEGKLPFRLRQALAALGPSAIGALVVAALGSQLAVEQPLQPALQSAVALATIFVVRKWRGGGTALPVFAGVLVFGLLQYLSA